MYITEGEIRDKVVELAHQISKDFERDQPIVLIGVLKGGFLFLADLSRELGNYFRNIEIGFIGVRSYNGTESGEFKLTYADNISVRGKAVLIVDDILDTGKSLKQVMNLFKLQDPYCVRTCVLLDKKVRRQVPIDPDYFGFDVPDFFYVGYGMDFNGLKRETPYILGLSQHK